jgi:hypothetical protein
MSTYALHWSAAAATSKDLDFSAAIVRWARRLMLFASICGLVGPGFLLLTVAAAVHNGRVVTDRLILWQLHHLLPLAASTVLAFLAPLVLLAQRLAAKPQVSAAHALAALAPCCTYALATALQLFSLT